MKLKFSLPALGAVTLVSLAAYSWFGDTDQHVGPVTEDRSTTGQSAGIQPTSTPPETSAKPNLAMQLAVQYLERYGETIEHPATQALLFNERLELLEMHPDNGAELFARAIQLAFPDQKIKILALMTDLERYQAWLEDNELRLQGLRVMERQAALWQQREAIFGDLANQIWADERNALEQKSEDFAHSLSRLNQADELQLQELAFQLQTTVDELYGNDLTAQMAGSGALGHTLFSMDSVQSQLKALPADDRQKKINDLRRQLGYSDAVVEKLAKEDQAREEKWEKGKAYMNERDSLAQGLSGQQLQNALQDLRQEYFGVTAPTIAREEKEGFFRFERRRRYGVN